MYKMLLLLTISSVMCAAELGALEIKAGVNYDIARNGLLSLGYKDSGLEMAPKDNKHEIKFMANDKHVLIFLTDKSNTDIVNIALYISDFGPKAHRFDRQYSVESIVLDGAKTKMLIVTDR